MEGRNPYDLVTAEDFLKNLPPEHMHDRANGNGVSDAKRRSASEYSNGEDGKEKDRAGAGTGNGTLRRIKGMVKNKSISLGLSKAPTDGKCQDLWGQFDCADG
jgi:hypothetical protein